MLPLDITPSGQIPSHGRELMVNFCHRPHLHIFEKWRIYYAIIPKGLRLGPRFAGTAFANLRMRDP
jgi:hypothetical protein